MSIILKQAFIQRGRNSMYKALNNTRIDLLSEINSYKQNDSQLKALGETLTAYYYGSVKNESATFNKALTKYHQILIDELSKTMPEAVNRFYSAGGKNGVSSKYKATTTAAESTIEKYLEKLKIRLAALKKAIADISKSNTQSIEKMEKMQGEIEELIKRTNTFLTAHKDDSTIKMFGRKFYNTNTGKDAIALIKDLDIYSSVIGSSQNMNMLKIGSAFEDSLVAALNAFVGEEVEQIFKKSFVASKTGDITTKRGVWKGKSLANISYDINMDANLFKNEQGKMKSGFTAKKGNVTFSFNPGSERFGKMDVKVDLYTTDPIGISAKSWTIGNSRSVGTTSVAAGLARAVGPNILEYYMLSMLDPKKDSFKKAEAPINENKLKPDCSEIGHYVAKLALASDIAMGLNQRLGGRAEILIIDTGSEIIVKNIASLVKNINNIIGYRKSDIQKVAQNIYDNMKHVEEHRTSTYYGLFISTLDKIKISYVLSQNLTD